MSKEHKTEADYEMVPLPEYELTKKLNSITGWEIARDHELTREYSFDKYLEGVNFAKQIGEYADTRKHHPSIKIEYKKVTVKIFSWQAKGITALDILMVEDFNEIYEKLNEDSA